MTQTWADVIFAHWEVDPERVRTRFPPGTRPDTLDGKTYVGMVALRVTATAVGGLFPTGGFLQNNVRLYSIDEEGRQGVVFLSMDVSRPDAVAVGRLLALQPVQWSRIDFAGDDGMPFYRCRRRMGDPPTSGALSVSVGPVLTEQGPLDAFLTARFGLHVRHPFGTAWVPVVHPPWLLHSAQLRDLDRGLVVATGVTPEQADPVSMLYSPGMSRSHIGMPAAVN